MQEVFIYMPESDAPDPVMAKLQRELSRAVAQRVKIYRTFVAGDEGVPCTFTTTSKEIHLQLGALSKDGVELLAVLLNPEFGSSQENQLLLFREPDKRMGILVTYSYDRDGHTFTLAPAH